MIANPNWFSQRKYGGWGLTPNSWQGWAYIIAVITPVALVDKIQIANSIKTPFILIWSTIFAIDLIHTMTRVKKDERDIAHEAIAERNAMWFMVTALVIGLGYQTASGIIRNSIDIDPVIIVSLLGAATVKSISHWYLRNR